MLDFVSSGLYIPSCHLTVRSFHLVRNPGVLEQLQREIASVPTDGEVTREQIQKLPFLRCCLNESMSPGYPLRYIVIDKLQPCDYIPHYL
jgi:hypothetical protein